MNSERIQWMVSRLVAVDDGSMGNLVFPGCVVGLKLTVGLLFQQSYYVFSIRILWG